MSQPSHWIEKITDDLEKRGDKVTVFSTAKTPSGPIHVGVGRELVYCSTFERLLRRRGRETRFLFFVDDFDSLKSFPPETPENFTKNTEYLGMPFYQVPCPYRDCGSWGEHYARELIDTLPDFGLNPQITWSHNLYQTPEMKNLIRTALQRVEDIRHIFEEVVSPTLSGEQLETFTRDLATWYPCLVLCKRCGRLKTGKVTGYHPEKDTLTYACAACGEEGEVPIGSWPVKLRWRIDWPAKWALFKVSCEPAGKDHCVRGGAYDTGEEICRKVFGCNGPYRIPYEWILLGERAMKTHKGISFTFKEWLAIAPPETYRYMILRDDPRKHINFQPERIPQLLDEFERAERIYYGAEEAANPEERHNVENIYPFSMPEEPSKVMPVRLPYRFAVILTQLTPLLGEEKTLAKAVEVSERLGGRPLTEAELKLVKGRLRKAAYWVENYAPEEVKIRIPEALSPELKSKLEESERAALKAILEMLKDREWNEKELQYEIFEVGKRFKIGAKIFEALYLIFLGKRSGPRLAPFLLSLEKNFIVKRLEEAVGTD